MKDQFQSTEALSIRFPPFTNKTTGDEIVGTDTCTIGYKKPDTTLGSASGVWDSDIQLWCLDIAVGSYAQGEWLFKAVSSDINGRPQRKVLQWGDYVDSLASLDAAVAILVKLGEGRWKVDASLNTLTIYNTDGVTPYRVFNLLGSDGLPNPHLVYERVPV